MANLGECWYLTIISIGREFQYFDFKAWIGRVFFKSFGMDLSWTKTEFAHQVLQ